MAMRYRLRERFTNAAEGLKYWEMFPKRTTVDRYYRFLMGRGSARWRFLRKLTQAEQAWFISPSPSKHNFVRELVDQYRVTKTIAGSSLPTLISQTGSVFYSPSSPVFFPSNALPFATIIDGSSFLPFASETGKVNPT